MYDNILFEITDNVAILTLNRPGHMNAVSNPLMDDLEHAMGRIVEEGARALLITGAGRAFCSGADLNEMNDIPREMRDTGERLEKRLNPLIERLRTLPMPVITAVNGAAAGGGLGIALCGDIVIAAKSAFFLCPFSKVGLVPDVGATWLLPRLVGKARATGMMLLAERISAEKAVEWGLIWQMVENEELPAAAFAIAKQLANGPSYALTQARLAIHHALESDLTSSLALERENQRVCGRTDDHNEGVTAFREKRPPVFKGA